MSRAKKVVFVIVEGSTDEVAISSVLKGMFTLHEIHFQEIWEFIRKETNSLKRYSNSY